jgi:hypothetical protein
MDETIKFYDSVRFAFLDKSAIKTSTVVIQIRVSDFSVFLSQVKVMTFG